MTIAVGNQSQMDSATARSITDKIKFAVDGTWQLIEQAYISRAWSALGYNSWDEYCTREFGTSRLRLPREERSDVIASLRESGLSIPAIAAGTGLSVGAVHSNLSELKGSEDLIITGTNGKTYQPKPRPIVDLEPGSSHKKPKTKRRPISEAFLEARIDITKTIERMLRITEDDRFPNHAAQLATTYKSDLIRSRDELNTIIDTLTEKSA